MSDVWVMRHGETEWNVRGLFQGHLDSPLTAGGRSDAARAARLLAGEGIAHIVTSDLGRAVATAAIVAAEVGIEVETDRRWRELDVGPELAGRPGADASGLPGYERRPGWRFPGGESLLDVRDRVLAALAAIADDSRPTLVVTHAGPCRILVAEATGLPCERILDMPRVGRALVARLTLRAGRPCAVDVLRS